MAAVWKAVLMAVALTGVARTAQAGGADPWTTDPWRPLQVFSARPKQPPPPDWCLCVRVCQMSRDPAYADRIPPGQSLAVCPQLHDEIIYDNRAACGCNRAAPVPGSPNH